MIYAQQYYVCKTARKAAKLWESSLRKTCRAMANSIEAEFLLWLKQQIIAGCQEI